MPLVSPRLMKRKIGAILIASAFILAAKALATTVIFTVGGVYAGYGIVHDGKDDVVVVELRDPPGQQQN